MTTETKRKLSQCDIVYNWLINKGSLTSHSAQTVIGVSRLASRISELRNNDLVDIKDKWIKLRNRFGEIVTVKEYWIE